ncbi:hypothetical protein BV20DRAFT_476226 [Pilatotrama ljubarskyi]|nr:hypothetical protein BV20DRAFT_476226 [Pilatotrama ljubarskyi]
MHYNLLSANFGGSATAAHAHARCLANLLLSRQDLAAKDSTTQVLALNSASAARPLSETEAISALLQWTREAMPAPS